MSAFEGSVGAAAVTPLLPPRGVSGAPPSATFVPPPSWLKAGKPSSGGGGGDSARRTAGALRPSSAQVASLTAAARVNVASLPWPPAPAQLQAAGLRGIRGTTAGGGGAAAFGGGAGELLHAWGKLDVRHSNTTNNRRSSSGSSSSGRGSGIAAAVAPHGDAASGCPSGATSLPTAVVIDACGAASAGSRVGSPCGADRRGLPAARASAGELPALGRAHPASPSGLILTRALSSTSRSSSSSYPDTPAHAAPGAPGQPKDQHSRAAQGDSAKHQGSATKPPLGAAAVGSGVRADSGRRLLSRGTVGSRSSTPTSGSARPSPASSARAGQKDKSKGKTAPPQPTARHPAVLSDDAYASPSAEAIEVPLDDKGRGYPYVQPPAFPGTCPTIASYGCAADKQAAGLHPLLHMKMLVLFCGIHNSPVKHAFREAGFRPSKGKKWNIAWGNSFSAEEYAKMHEFQKTNHFPGTGELGVKSQLYRNVYNMRRAKGDAFDFVPRHFVLPRDYDEFIGDAERHPSRLYIRKPTNSSRGRGIRMVTKPSEVTRDTKDVLVQHYIDNPYIINRRKFDLRIYVAATCLDPLRLYVYHDGLARFAVGEYSDSKADLKKRSVHLTNYSVSKKLTNVNANEVIDADGNTTTKWSLDALRAHIEAEGRVPWEHVWRQVHDIVVHTMLAVEPHINPHVKLKVPHRNNCFEVWGFDIMLDAVFKAWLIEVNTYPSLAADSQVDRRVKYAMVGDLLHMLGVVPYDVDKYVAVEAARKQAKLTGLNKAHGGGGAAPAGAQGPRTVHDAAAVDFRGMRDEDLPDIVRECEAELARCRGWQRVFPCVEDPHRYLDMFDTPRSSNIMVCNYYAQRAKKTPWWHA